MPGLDIKITDEQVRSITGKAILELLGADQREAIVQRAIEGLILVPERVNSYGSIRGEAQKSEVERMFERAMRDVAIDVVHNLVKTDEALRGRLAFLAGKIMMQALEDPRVIERASAALVDVLTTPPRES